MKKRIAILFYLIVHFSTCFGSNLDSLLRVLKTQNEDTNKVRTLLYLQDVYSQINVDTASMYMRQAEKLNTKLLPNRFESVINVCFIEHYFFRSDYQNAIAYALKNVALARKSKDDNLLARAYNNVTVVYSRFGQYKLALEYGQKALDLTEKISDTINLSFRLATMCNLYNDINQHRKAIEFGLKGIELAKRYNNTYALLLNMNNTAVSYSSLYMLDSAIYYYDQQIKIGKEKDHHLNVVMGNVNIILSMYKKGDLKSMLPRVHDMNKSIAEFGIDEDKGMIAYQQLSNACYQICTNNFDEAEKYIMDGIAIAKQDSNVDAIMSLYELYSKLYYLKGDIKNGELYFYKSDSIQEAVFSDELKQFALDLETKYETQKKENEILKQEQQIKKRNTWLTILAIILTASLLLFYFFSKYQKNKNLLLENEKKNQQQKIIALEKEKQLQATESILKGQEDERSRIAKDLHDGLGGLLSGVKYSLNNMKENVFLSSENATSFERTVDMLDSGIQELRRVAHNMMPENLIKFGLDTALKDYCTSISNTGKLNINYSSFGMNNYNTETNVSITVYRVIQELINNSMKHAEATQSIVQIANENNILHITVEDNGKGFDVQNINNFKGAGWTNIQNRITYLKGKIHVDSNEKNGTSVIIEIPLA
jgi:two-component system NarL family sensor kinase